MANLIASEIAKRNNGIIPNNLGCDVCGHEIEGDRYEFDENTYACNICYESNPEVQKDVAEWKA